MKITEMTRLRSVLKKCFLLFVLAAISACSGDEDDITKENEEAGGSNVTLNGGYYNNLTAKSSAEATGVYNPDDDVTAIAYTTEANDEDFVVIISFPGKEAGQKNWDIDQYCYVQVAHEFKNSDKTMTATYYDLTNNTFTVHPGHVTIDSYGDIGDIISGSFEGKCTFMHSESGHSGYGTMKGTFKARRTQ